MPLKFERPSPRYLRELNEVARDASSLADFISKENLLPNDFPNAAICILCVGLASLPEGTAEGSIGILTHAESRLKSWRYAFLKHAQTEDVSANDDTDEPVTRRGERLDEPLKELLVSVGTAIECYKLEAGEDIDPDIEPESELPADVDIDRQQALDSVGSMGKAALDLKNKIILANPSDLEATDTPKRILADVDNQAKASRSELLLPAPRPNYLKKLRSMGAASWQAIEKASAPAKSMGSLIGFGGLLAESPELALLGAAIGAAGHFVSLVEVSIQHLLSKAKEAQIAEIVENKTLPFDLAEAYAMILRGEAPPQAWVPFIVTLSFSRAKLPDASALSQLTALQSLNLASTDINDLSFLSNLLALRKLNISKTTITDISVLTRLRALRFC